MTRTTTTKRNKDGASLNVFLVFETRLRSLEFARAEVLRCRADGEEILASMADAECTGDRWLDARARARWEQLLDEAFQKHAAACEKLCWELEDAGVV